MSSRRPSKGKTKRGKQVADPSQRKSGSEKASSISSLKPSKKKLKDSDDEASLSDRDLSSKAPLSLSDRRKRTDDDFEPLRRALKKDTPPSMEVTAQIEPVLPRREPVASDFTFSRFQGVSRLFNWFYSSKEEELLDLQKRLQESLAETRELFKNNPAYSGASFSKELDEIELELRKLSDQPIKDTEQEAVERKLKALRDRFDQFSAQQAILLGFDSTFAIGSPQTLPSKEELIKEIRNFSVVPSLHQIGRLRYLVDALSQWTSDAIMRYPDEAFLDVLQFKDTVAEAATFINEAFFYGVIKRDYRAAESNYLRATSLLSRLDLTPLLGIEGAEPKAREDWNTPFDPGALMLAATLNDNEFVPDLVVGLPTGGVHAANKLAGALAVLKKERPLLWYTRPRAVKEASKKIFQDVSTDNILRQAEVEFLAEKLKPKVLSRPLKILVVDDGAVSGKTLEIARQLYTKTFLKHYSKIDVRTAIVKGGSGVEAEILPSGLPNSINYVVNQTNDRVGSPAILREREPKRTDGKTFGTQVDPSARVALDTLVDIHSEKKSRTIKLGETLSEAN